MGFFYDEYLEKPVFDEKFSKAVIADVLNRFLESFDLTDDSTRSTRSRPTPRPLASPQI